MIVTDKSGNKINVFRHMLSTGSIKKGDFVEVHGHLGRIVEIQRGCPSINKFGSGFTICLVETKDGKRTTIRPVHTIQVWRGKRVQMFICLQCREEFEDISFAVSHERDNDFTHYTLWSPKK